MYKLTKLISFTGSATAAEREQLAQMLNGLAASDPNVLRARLRAVGPGAVNGGDVVWHVQFMDEGAYRACGRSAAWRALDRALADDPVSHVESVAYAQGVLGVREPAIRDGVHRILLLAIRPGMSPEKISRFEAEMREMPRYLPAIRNWSLSRVTEAAGTRPWTHVWEQEFQDVAGLVGPYMMHPIHFASIDRWFDPESHDWIVDPWLCHTLCGFEQGMLTPPCAEH